MAESLDFLDGPLESEDSFTLTLIRSSRHIILGKKSRGYGQGQLVLPGGKDHYYLGSTGVGVIPGSDNASREVFEEIGLDVPSRGLLQVGMLHVATEDDNKDIRIFEAHTRHVAPTDSQELTDVTWYDETALPYDQMPEDYRLWLPHVLSGYAVTAYFETDHDRILDGSVFRQQCQPLGRLEQAPVSVV